MWSEEGSQTQRYWGAATVNNAVQEFHDYASQDGILAPGFIDIYVGKNQRYGFATMTNQIFGPAMAIALGSGLTGNNYFIEPFGLLLSVFTPAQILILFMPDLFVGIKYHYSDRLTRLAYHEIAHASHFENVNTSYWMELIAAEVAANGHGNQYSNDAGRIALCESWAEHIGLTYAHRKYGNNYSINKTYEKKLEETRNETTHHIPIGLYHDLFDPHIDDILACDESSPSACGLIDDQVSGFTFGHQFGLLTSTVETPNEFINNLKMGQSAAVQSKIQTLFNSY